MASEPKRLNGLRININGCVPKDEKIHDIYRDLQSVMYHPSRQLIADYMTLHVNPEDIDFHMNLILWDPFGNEIAHHVWQDIDLLLEFKNVTLCISNVIGLRDSAGEIKEVE